MMGEEEEAGTMTGSIFSRASLKSIPGDLRHMRHQQIQTKVKFWHTEVSAPVTSKHRKTIIWVFLRTILHYLSFCVDPLPSNHVQDTVKQQNVKTPVHTKLVNQMLKSVCLQI